MEMTSIEINDYLSTAQVAAKLSLTTDTVKKYCQSGKIAAIKAGQSWLISKSEVARYRKNRQPAGRPIRAS